MQEMTNPNSHPVRPTETFHSSLTLVRLFAKMLQTRFIRSSGARRLVHVKDSSVDWRINLMFYTNVAYSTKNVL